MRRLVAAAALAGALATTVALGGCGDDNLLGVGQACASSGECATGLVCDFTHTPHVCASMQSLARDLSIPIHDAGVRDLPAID